MAHRRCIPSAQTRDTRSVFVGKLVKDNKSHPHLSLTLCVWKFQEQGQEARSLPGEGGACRPILCIIKRRALPGSGIPASGCALTCQAHPLPRGGTWEPLREECSLGG